MRYFFTADIHVIVECNKPNESEARKAGVLAMIDRLNEMGSEKNLKIVRIET